MSRSLIYAIVTLAMMLCTSLSVPEPQQPRDPNDSDRDKITFEGKLESIAPEIKIVSGLVVIYRLAKYRVMKVCEGRYDRREMVVDHLILTGQEFEGIQPGDLVRVSVQKSSTILSRYDAIGIRKPSDVVKVYFIGSRIEQKVTGDCCCSGQGK